MKTLFVTVFCKEGHFGGTIIAMILRFTFSNFRSCRDEQSLSLVSSRGTCSDHAQLFAGPNRNLSVVPVAAIYGANASGKTNVLKALSFFKGAVQNSQTKWTPNGKVNSQAFAFADLSTPTRFELDFQLGDALYTYGFTVEKSLFQEEWLHLHATSRPQVVFRRLADGTFIYGRSFTGNKRAVESTLRKNSLFLSAGAQNNNELLLSIYSWISSWLFASHDRDVDVMASSGYLDNEHTCKKLITYLETADLGIVGLKKVEGTDEEKALFEKVLSALPAEVTSQLPAHQIDSASLELVHRGPAGREVAFGTGDESNGTLAFLYLLGLVLTAIEQGLPVFIDELDESLHSSLGRKLVELFTSPSSNKLGAQLIFNTHDTNLLDLDLICREEIWFAEKDRGGATHLYPLTDFKPRAAENVGRGYLQGKYGAVPFLGDLDRLIAGTTDE